MSQFAKRLAGMREAWKQGRESGGSSTVPPGVYTAQLAACDLAESQSSNKLQIHREFLITEGESSGESLHDYMQIETEKGPFFIELWLKKMGYDLDGDFDPTALEEILAELQANTPTVRIRVVEKNGFTNVRVLQLLEGESAPAKPAKAGKSAPAEEAGEGEGEGEGEGDGGEEAGEAAGQETGGEEDAELKGELIALAQNFSVEVSDEDSVEDLKDKLHELAWDGSTLEEHEVALLEKCGIEVANKPKPKPAAKKPAPAPAKKPAAKAAPAPAKKSAAPAKKSFTKRK